MERFIIILFLIILSLPLYNSICEEGQIDINQASLEELQEFTGIGPVKAQAIIDYRKSKRFESVDELIEVYGIGPATLANIKNEGACVVDENSTKEEIGDEVEDEEKEQNEDEKSDEDIENYKNEDLEENYLVIDLEKNKAKNLTLNPINLNINDIKDKNKENPDWAIYGILIFCVLLGFLFIERKRRLNKNEFE